MSILSIKKVLLFGMVFMSSALESADRSITGAITHMCDFTPGLTFVDSVSKIALVDVNEKGLVYQIEGNKFSHVVTSLSFVPVQRAKDTFISIDGDNTYSLMLAQTVPIIERYDFIDFHNVDSVKKATTYPSKNTHRWLYAPEKLIEPSRIIVLARNKERFIYGVFFEENADCDTLPNPFFMSSYKFPSRDICFSVEHCIDNEKTDFNIRVFPEKGILHSPPLKKWWLINYVVQTQARVSDVKNFIVDYLCKSYMKGSSA